VVPSIKDGRRVRGSFVERGRGVDVMWRGDSIALCLFFFLAYGFVWRGEKAAGAICLLWLWWFVRGGESEQVR